MSRKPLKFRNAHVKDDGNVTFLKPSQAAKQTVSKDISLKFRNAHIDHDGNISFLKPGQKAPGQLAVSSSGNVSVKSPINAKSSPVASKMQNNPFTNTSLAGTSSAPGQVQFITSQGVPIVPTSSSSIIVPQIGSMPALQNTANPVQILQRTTILHGTGKTPASVGQTFSLVPCVGSTIPGSTVQLVQNQPTSNIQIVQNQPSSNVQILQNQPQGNVQIVQNPVQGNIQFIQNQPQVCITTDAIPLNQSHGSMQVLSSHNSGVQLVSNAAQVMSNPVQQPSVQVVRTPSGELKLLSSGVVGQPMPVLNMPNSIILPPQNITRTGDGISVGGNLVQGGQAKGDKSDKDTNDQSRIGDNSDSITMKHLLKPKFVTTLNQPSNDPSGEGGRKGNRKKGSVSFHRIKLPELLPKANKPDPPKEKENDKAVTNSDDSNQPSQAEKKKQIETISDEPNKKTETESDHQKDEHLAVIINKEQQFQDSEGAKISFGGTSVKPKFAIEFSPTNLQAYVQAVANAVENHKTLFEQNKPEIKHKKKKNKHKSKEFEAELIVEPPRELATVSKSSRRKQKLNVRKDLADSAVFITEPPKVVFKRKKREPQLTVDLDFDAPFPELVANKSNSTAKKSKISSSGSVVNMKETEEDLCVDVVGEMEPKIESSVPREVGVFIPPSLSKCIVRKPSVQPQYVGQAKRNDQPSSKTQSGALAASTCSSTSSIASTSVSTSSSISSASELKDQQLPVPLDKIKEEPQDEVVPKFKSMDKVVSQEMKSSKEQVKCSNVPVGMKSSTEALQKTLNPRTETVAEKVKPSTYGFPNQLINSPDSNEYLKKLLSKTVVRGKTLSVVNKTSGESDKVSLLTQNFNDKTQKKTVPVSVESIKQEPCESSVHSVVQEKPSKKHFEADEIKRLKEVAKMSSPLRVTVNAAGESTISVPHTQPFSVRDSVNLTLKERPELDPMNHHHTPVNEITALQKMITSIAKDIQTCKAVQTNIQCQQQSFPMTGYPTSLGQPFGSLVTSPKPTSTPVLSGIQINNPNPPLVTKIVEAPKASSVVSPQVIPQGNIPAATSVSTNLAKLLGPFSFPQNAAPVATMHLTKNPDNQQKQVFIVPNAVYTALLSAQASTGKTVQLTSSQLLAGKVIPTSITSQPLSAVQTTAISMQNQTNSSTANPLLPAAIPMPHATNPVAPLANSLLPTVIQSTSNPVVPTVIQPTSNSVAPTIIHSISNPVAPRIIQSTSNPVAPRIIQSTSNPVAPRIIQSTSNPVAPRIIQSTSNPVAPTVNQSTPVLQPPNQTRSLLSVPVAKTGMSAQLSCSSSVPAVKLPPLMKQSHDIQDPSGIKDSPTSDSVKPAEEVTNENVEVSEELTLELKIDSVFSLNKVSCKLLDKVPSYLEMCLNSELEHSMKLCFVVLDSKLPPMFRGKTGTKRTRLVVPKVCSVECRSNALDKMCIKNKWHKNSSQAECEPPKKRAKKGEIVSS